MDAKIIILQLIGFLALLQGAYGSNLERLYDCKSTPEKERTMECKLLLKRVKGVYGRRFAICINLPVNIRPDWCNRYLKDISADEKSANGRFLEQYHDCLSIPEKERPAECKQVLKEMTVYEKGMVPSVGLIEDSDMMVNDKADLDKVNNTNYRIAKMRK